MKHEIGSCSEVVRPTRLQTNEKALEVNKNLVWCSVASLSSCTPELFGPNREFDVLVHFYEEPNYDLPKGEIWEWRHEERKGIFHYYLPGEKLNVAGRVLSDNKWLMDYQQVAFLDDDLTISTEDLNRLFRVGSALRLPLYQPALAPRSFGSHSHLYQQTRGRMGNWTHNLVRWVPFVEIMCPFFSKTTLESCLPTFDINESGWGLDCFLWPKVAQSYVIDAISVGHYRMPMRRDRVLRNGLTPMQELWIQQVIDNPYTASHFPPGYKRPII
jgi:hypothetical protein